VLHARARLACRRGSNRRQVRAGKASAEAFRFDRLAAG